MWSQINVDTVPLLYVAIGAFLCLFMLFSSVIKERLYFGEANVALLVGAILGPFATKAVNPNLWPDFDLVVLEFSRVVLIIQCFAVALELPKHYVTKHWRSLFWVVGPVVVWGWMMSSLLIWWMFAQLSFIQSMTIASCFISIDPVLAATIVGRSKFAKRIPKHIRDLLLAESASNDVTTSVCLGLSILLTRFPGTAREVAQSLLLYTILYQILLAGTVGLILGLLAQRALRYADKHDSTDRHSFLAFYLMVALLCAGLGSLMGIDDVLLAFCAGYAFDKEGWFRERSEETYVSGTVDLLLNLTFFVFLGAMIPWRSFNQPKLGIAAWRLVVCTFFIFLFRRIPAILCLKPFIPNIKTWREALFYGHFGPIGVGAIFSAVVISSEPGKTGVAGNLLAISPKDPMQTSLWPIVTFVVLCSSIVHGSSVPLFILGKAINELTITFSYSVGRESNIPHWMDRLPRVSSQARSIRSKSSDSARSLGNWSLDLDRSKSELPHNSLRRHSDSDLKPDSKLTRRKWIDDHASARHVSESSIYPSWSRHDEMLLRTTGVSSGPSSSRAQADPNFGDKDLEIGLGHPGNTRAETSETETPIKSSKEQLSSNSDMPYKSKQIVWPIAYQFGNEIVIEDEHGKILKTYELLSPTSGSTRNRSQPGFTEKVNKKMTKEELLNEIQEQGSRILAEGGLQREARLVLVPPASTSADSGVESATERQRHRDLALGFNLNSHDSTSSKDDDVDFMQQAAGSEFSKKNNASTKGSLMLVAVAASTGNRLKRAEINYGTKMSTPKVILTLPDDEEATITLQEPREQLLSSDVQLLETSASIKGKEKAS